MAMMVPGRGPREFTAESREGEIYGALARLPEGFVVVHSMKLARVEKQVLRENEFDFVVFHRKLGIVCIESKAGAVRYEAGEWRYASGRSMKGGGPFEQAARAKYRLRDRFEDVGLGALRERCKFLHAVWFPSVSDAALRGIDFPSEVERRLVLTGDDLLDPGPKLHRIYAIEVNGGHARTELSDSEAQLVLDKVLCPEFNIVPSERLRYDLANIRFVQLLKSQQRVLDFLQDQRFAVVNGVAGSGKTLIAIERARRVAAGGERVLFLCFNAMLKEVVAARCADADGIDVFTMAGFATRECGCAGQPDYEALADKLIGYLDGGFPYRHVIVDEGQDFAVEALERAHILEALHEVVVGSGGTMFLFYDRNQLVQGSAMPGFIEKADSKITLYVNCRNTKTIAECSFDALDSHGKCEVLSEAATGRNPRLFASADTAAQSTYVDRKIAEYRKAGVTDIVVLTCKTEAKTVLAPYLTRVPGKLPTWRDTGVRFVTCRRFKGLEAEAAILVDVDASIWMPQRGGGRYATKPGLLFYTAASRARHELAIVCDMDERECRDLLEFLGGVAKRKPVRDLARRLGALPDA